MALPILENSTILYINGFRNGSLFSQIQNNLSSTAIYYGNSEDQGLSLTILADNVASLIFNASGFLVPGDPGYDADSLNGTFALAETLFDPNASRFPITCAYPISGQYDTLSRALFYFLMIFSLVFRRHIWISVAALGTALAYSAVSAVHTFALLSQFGFNKNVPAYDINSSQKFADIDVVGILPVLAASAIMVTPILLWSTTVRKNDAQSIIVWWGMLIFSSLACLIYNLQNFNLNKLSSFAICTKDCIPKADVKSFTLTFKTYQSCNCMDFCGTVGPSAPMREGSNMVPLLNARSDTIIAKHGFQNLFAVNMVALVFIIIYGIMGLIVSRFSPDEVRNGIFRFFNSDLRLWLKVIFEGEREDRALAYFKVTEKRRNPTIWNKCKYVFAKTMATLFSLTAGATAIICPAVFVSTVVANEILLQSYPVSELSGAVGAWATWVGALLVLVAAGINKYAGSWVRTFQVIVYSVWRLVKYSKDDRTKLYPAREGWSVATRLKLFGLVLASPPVHAWWSLAGGFWTLRTTIHFFLVWWKDTVNVSQQRGAEIKSAWEKVELTKPQCHCYICKHDQERAKEEEGKKMQQDYNAMNATSGSDLLPGTAPIPLSTTPVSSHPLMSVSTDVDEVSSTSQTVLTSGQGQPPSLVDIPLPTPRSTFTRQSTDRSTV